MFACVFMNKVETEFLGKEFLTTLGFWQKYIYISFCVDSWGRKSSKLSRTL